MEFRFKIFVLIIINLFSFSVGAQSLVFFIHRDVLESTINDNMVRDIYLKKMRFWKDGRKIRPLDHAVGTIDKNKLNKVFLGKTEVELTEHWIQEKQQTGAVQPLQVQNPDMLIYLVETMTGSVGYLDNTPDNIKLLQSKKVKVLQYD